jgi:tRNA(fMet)-specific endonuclease VapC
MENEIICLDTSILIDFYRKRLKEKSTFYRLTKVYNLLQYQSLPNMKL